MEGFIKVAQTHEIPDGSSKLIRLGKKSIALFNIDGTIFAIHNICPHEGGPLNEGTVEGCQVICPWHGIPFDLRTGFSTSQEGFGVTVFETKIIEEKDIFLKFPT